MRGWSPLKDDSIDSSKWETSVEEEMFVVTRVNEALMRVKPKSPRKRWKRRFNKTNTSNKGEKTLTMECNIADESSDFSNMSQKEETECEGNGKKSKF